MVRKKSSKTSPTRQTTCEHCGYKHYVMEGGWAVNGAKQVLCYSDRRNCFVKVRDMRSADRASQANGFVLSLDD